MAQKVELNGIQYSFSGLSAEFVCCIAAYVDSLDNLVRDLYEIHCSVQYCRLQVDECGVTFEIPTADFTKVYIVSNLMWMSTDQAWEVKA